MSFFPKVGATYSSIAAFKLDVLERGRPSRSNFGIRSSVPGTSAAFHCSNSCDTGWHCNCRIFVNRNKNHLFEVTSLDRQHTCQGSRLNEDARLRRIKTKIKNLKRQVSSEERERLSAIREREKIEGNEASSGSESEESEKSDGPSNQSEGTNVTSSGTRLRQRQNGKSMKESSEEEEEEESEVESSTDGSNSSETDDERQTTRARRGGARQSTSSQSETRRRFPPAQDVAEDVRLLLSAGIINLPSLGDDFDDSRQLLIHLYAYASQSGFRIYRRSSATKTNWVRMICYRSHPNWVYKPGGRCGFVVEASADDEGRWQVIKVEGGHNHEDIEPIIDEDSSSSSDESIVAVDSPQKRKRQASPPRPLPQSSRNDTFLVPQIPSRSRPTAFQRPRLSATSSSSSSSPSTDLANFLLPFLSANPHRLPHFLTILSAIGIANVEALTTIVCLEKETFDRFLNAVEDEETKELIKAVAEDMKRNI